MANLYDEDRLKLKQIGQDLNVKWDYVVRKIIGLDLNPLASKHAQQMIQLWHDEAVKRYGEAGWEVEVDVTPALAGVGVPIVNVVNRLERHHFDHDKYGWEIKKSKAQGGV
jgi:hypothetical protein